MLKFFIKEDEERRKANPWAIAVGAGTEIVVSVLAGFLVGQWLDRKLNSAPWLMLAGALIGISVGLYQIVKIAQRRGQGGSGGA